MDLLITSELLYQLSYTSSVASPAIIVLGGGSENPTLRLSVPIICAGNSDHSLPVQIAIVPSANTLIDRKIPILAPWNPDLQPGRQQIARESAKRTGDNMSHAP